jgi:threonyl-tRNA synthetase
MKAEELNKLAKSIFKTVEKDLRDRKGIRHEWDQVDEEIQEEIRAVNQKKILAVLKKALM